MPEELTEEQKGKLTDKGKMKGSIISKLPECPAKDYDTPSLNKVVTKLKVSDPKYHPQYVGESVMLYAKLPNGRLSMSHRSLVTVDCGFEMDLPSGYRVDVTICPRLGGKGMIVPSSSLDGKEVSVTVLNCGREIVVINDGDCFAQMTLRRVCLFDWIGE